MDVGVEPPGMGSRRVAKKTAVSMLRRGTINQSKTVASNGDAGRPALLYRFAPAGLSAQA